MPRLTNQLDASEVARAVHRNVDAVVKLEEEFLRNRTLSDRIADAIASLAGSLKFVAIHVLLYGLWILLNSGWFPGLPKFDPFPYMLLSMVVSLEAIFLSAFVLIKQNRMSRREDLRAHLDLQINLLTEREMTLVLQILQRISVAVGVRLTSTEVEELSAFTKVEDLATELQERLPES